MSKAAVFHPRFSVRNAFDDGVVSVANGRYSVGKHDKTKPEPRYMSCYNPDGKPVVLAKGQPATPVRGKQVQANYPGVQSNTNPAAKPNSAPSPQGNTNTSASRRGINRTRMDRTRQEPNPDDRRYWRSKDVVNTDGQDEATGDAKEERQASKEAEKQASKGSAEKQASKEAEKQASNEEKQEVAKPRWQAEPYNSERRLRATVETSTKEDRQHWMGRTVVQGDKVQGKTAQGGKVQSLRQAKVQDRNKQVAQRRTAQGRGAQGLGTVIDAQPPRQQVEAMTRKDLNKMGVRENHIQRQIRRRLTVKTSGGVEVEIPEEALSGEEFTLVVPGDVDLEGQFQVQNNPLPSHLSIDTSKDIEGRPVADDEDARQNRNYWGGKEVVYAANSASKARFLPKNE